MNDEEEQFIPATLTAIPFDAVPPSNPVVLAVRLAYYTEDKRMIAPPHALCFRKRFPHRRASGEEAPAKRLRATDSLLNVSAYYDPDVMGNDWIPFGVSWDGTAPNKITPDNYQSKSAFSIVVGGAITLFCHRDDCSELSPGDKLYVSGKHKGISMFPEFCFPRITNSSVDPEATDGVISVETVLPQIKRALQGSTPSKKQSVYYFPFSADDNERERRALIGKRARLFIEPTPTNALLSDEFVDALALGWGNDPRIDKIYNDLRSIDDGNAIYLACGGTEGTLVEKGYGAAILQQGWLRLQTPESGEDQRERLQQLRENKYSLFIPPGNPAFQEEFEPYARKCYDQVPEEWWDAILIDVLGFGPAEAAGAPQGVEKAIRFAQLGSLAQPDLFDDSGKFYRGEHLKATLQRIADNDDDKIYESLLTETPPEQKSFGIALEVGRESIRVLLTPGN